MINTQKDLRDELRKFIDPIGVVDLNGISEFIAANFIPLSSLTAWIEENQQQELEWPPEIDSQVTGEQVNNFKDYNNEVRIYNSVVQDLSTFIEGKK